MSDLPDIQKEIDQSGISIDRVGISDLKYPITVLDRAKNTQSTIADVKLGVAVPTGIRGTHMSRFVSLVENWSMHIDLNQVEGILKMMLTEFETNEAEIYWEFPYFILKRSPISMHESKMLYTAGMGGRIFTDEQGDDHVVLELRVKVPVTTLCPCSKEISDRGAHNQRAIVDIRIAQEPGDGFIWIEELIMVAESCASCDIYPLLKREDEKYVTEHAYDNPRFVEDLIRLITIALRKDSRIRDFEINVFSDESIHAHRAWANLYHFKGD